MMMMMKEQLVVVVLLSPKGSALEGLPEAPIVFRRLFPVYSGRGAAVRPFPSWSPG